MTKDEALKLALEALELINIEFVCGNGSHNAKKDRHEWDEPCPITDRWKKAITAIKEALAQSEQEPVAWRWGVPKLKNGDFEWRYSLHQTRPDAIPLYTTPPKRTWVGLTLDERIELAKDVDWAIGAYCEYAEKIEAKLKEKNT